MQLHGAHIKGPLYLVGMGTPAHAAAFKQETGVDLPVLLSSDMAAYKAMDLPRASTARVFAPGALLKTPGRRASIVARLPEQDWHQLGGAFVIDAGGEIVWAHRSKHPGDNPSPAEIEGALSQ